MKYDYKVKVNGKWYQPNEEIPEEKPVETVETPVETASDEAPKAKKSTKKD